MKLSNDSIRSAKHIHLFRHLQCQNVYHLNLYGQKEDVVKKVSNMVLYNLYFKPTIYDQVLLD